MKYSNGRGKKHSDAKLKQERRRLARVVLLDNTLVETEKQIDNLYEAHLHLLALTNKLFKFPRSTATPELRKCAKQIGITADAVVDYHLQLQALMHFVLADYKPPNVEMAKKQ